ncbi:MAG: hypothetical protein ACFB10_03365 [Salibacteraceae bacterium]
MKWYPEDTMSRFQFQEILLLLEERCRSRKGKELAIDLRPVSDRRAITTALYQTHELLRVHEEGRYFPAFDAPDSQSERELLAVNGAALEAAQFGNLLNIISTANGVVRFLKSKHEEFPNLGKLVQYMTVCKEVAPLINKVIDGTTVKSSASRELARIRKNLSSKRQHASRLFQAEMRKFQRSGWLREFGESSWNQRRVLAVLSEYKRQVNGILHGSSDTGRTAFIEPGSTVEINNQLIELEQEEKQEIHRILKELTAQMAVFQPEFNAAAELLGELDLIRAKMRLAQALDAKLPSLSKDRSMDVLEARHPLLYLQNEAEGKKTVPLTLHLNQNNRVLIISGPNAGGKSIALKTLGLLQLMVQSGMLLPAHENTVMGIFDRIFVDIGDDQSIEMELSTYSSRLVKMKYFLEFADASTFFFIDEFGTGSDPELGSAIAESILEQLTDSKAYGIITTHYSNIKLLADATPGLVNACMLFDEESLRPLYELIVGQPGSSYTFEVASKIGLNKKLLKAARQKLDGRKVKLDAMLVRLQKDQQRLAEREKELLRELDVTEEKAEMYSNLQQELRAQLASEKADRDQINKMMELGRRYKALLDYYDQTGDRKQLIKKLMIAASQEKQKRDSARKQAKNEALQKEQSKKAREKANRKVEARRKKAELAREKIEVGSMVRLKTGKEKGEVASIEGNKATVLFGFFKTIAAVKDLRLVEKKQRKPQTKSATTAKNPTKPQAQPQVAKKSV